MRLRRAVSAVAVVAAGVAALPAVAASRATAEDLTALVNPLAGSLGPGFVTVAAGMPFGMVTPGAITTTPAGEDPVNYVGYGYQDPQIRGFALTHFSGAGIHIGGELPFMPTTGPMSSGSGSSGSGSSGSGSSSDPAAWASPYTHAQETAQPGYYSVMLDRYQVQAELTATTRTAVERYTFPATTQANLLLDITRDNDSNQANPPKAGGTQQGALQIGDDNRTVTGHVDVPGSNGITIYFTARFDRPFASHGNWDDGGGWVTFDTTNNPTVGVRVGLSYTDATGATNNLNAEAPDGTSFDAVKARAQAAWNARLHSIDVAGGSQSQQQTFYTSLYHSLLMPPTYDDVDGRYLGFDGPVHTVDPGHHHYTDLSLWDTYRTQTPLLTLAAPDVAHDVGISLLDDTDQNHGVIPCVATATTRSWAVTPVRRRWRHWSPTVRSVVLTRSVRTTQFGRRHC